MDDLEAGLTALAEGSEALRDGVGDYTGGVEAVAAGYRELTDGYAQLLEGHAQLADGAAQLAQGTDQLAQGTKALDDPETLSELADSLLDGVLGGGGEAVSFVSSRNTRVDAVQFVLLSQGIHVTETRAQTVQAEASTFLSRLLALFGVGN